MVYRVVYFLHVMRNRYVRRGGCLARVARFMFGMWVVCVARAMHVVCGLLVLCSVRVSYEVYVASSMYVV